MILVDTSVWIHHIRSADERLTELIRDDSVLTHPLVIEEVACGHIRNRAEIIGLLHSLPSAHVADHREVLGLISNKNLFGVGLGAIDVHLIAAALLSDAIVWSRDKALTREAVRLGVGV